MHSALHCLIMLAQWHRLKLPLRTLADAWQHSDQSLHSIVQIAQDHGMKARCVRQDWSRIQRAPFPVIASLQNGECCVVGRYLPEGQLPKDSSHGQSSMQQAGLLVQLSGQPPVVMDLATFRQRATGEFIYLRPRKSALLRSSGVGASIQSLLFTAVLRNRALLMEVLVLCLALQCLALLTPMFFQVVTDKVLVNHAQATLQVIVVGLLLAGTFETLFSGVRSAALARLSARVDTEVGQGLMNHVLSLPMSYFSARRAGDTLARVREAENIRAFFTGPGLNALMDLAFAVLFMGVMLFYSAELTGLVLISIIAYALVSWFFSPVLIKRLEQRFNTAADTQAFLVESLNGISTIKTLGLSAHCLRDWNTLLAATARAVLRHSHALLFAQGAVTFISRVVQVGLLAWGAKAVMENRLTVGELLAFNMLASQVSGPVLRLSQLWAECQQLKVSLRRMGDLFSVSPELQGQGVSAPNLKGAIEFDRVRFRYRPDLEDTLQEVSFQLQPGEVLGIVGSSGSGKSTLVQLLLGLHSICGGRILLDGFDLSTIDRQSLRNQMGVVMQESFLFDRSVRDNIAISAPLASLERVVAAARLAGAHEFIVNLPQGYDTPMGEQGRVLSGGQRQRIAIARALIKNPRILIFDEATSALDVESEFAIHQHMKQICANRTVIVIAHRLSAVRHANRIIVMQKGRIVESGSRQSLLEKQDGYFHRMHQLQLQGML